MIEDPVYVDALNLSNKLLDGFAAGEISEIYLAYTNFKNTVVHIPKMLKLLPVGKGCKTGSGRKSRKRRSDDSDEF